MCVTDDSWMDVTPDSFDAMLNKASGRSGTCAGQEADLEQVTRTMNSFINKVSGLDGAEFPK